MTEPTLLPVTPGSLSADDKATLREAGVIVIEHEHPETLRLLRPAADLDSSELLACAMKALCDPNNASVSVQASFTRAFGAAIANKKKA